MRKALSTAVVGKRTLRRSARKGADAITFDGRDVAVVLNGKETAKLRNGMFDEGPIALQNGAGTIKLRKVQLKEF